MVEVTGLPNPCIQIERFQRGLQAAVLARATDGSIIRKAGIMGVVLIGGQVRAQDGIDVELLPTRRRWVGRHYFVAIIISRNLLGQERRALASGLLC